MKTKHLSGMRDIPTIQGLKHRSLPGTREQTVAEVARLEHEKSRLQRELDIWMANRQRTETRIRQVEGRLTALQEILDPPGTERSKKRSRVRGSPGERAEGTDGTHPDEGGVRKWREIPLEY